MFPEDEEGFVGLSDEDGDPLDLASFVSGWGFDPDPEDDGGAFGSGFSEEEEQ